MRGFYKITVLGLFFLSRLICEIGLYAGIYESKKLENVLQIPKIGLAIEKMI